jgi:putative tryptophan/tyrosine transport system substrate-binding protein
MRRREFIAGTAATAAMSFTRPVCAQIDARSPGKRIAFVHLTEKLKGLTVKGRYKAFFGELNRLGYIEGQNLVVERYSALGQTERYGVVAGAAVASHPDLIISIGTPLARLLKPLTATIPILTTSADPIASGLVTNLAKPDGNITGINVDVGSELYGKRLQFLRETVGKLTNARLLIPASAIMYWEMVTAPLLQRTGIPITAAVLADKVVDREAYERVFDAMEAERVDGLVVGDSPEHITNREVIVDLAARHRLPTIYPYREYVDVGGLASYGTDTADLLRRLADMADQILRGAKPGDIPFYQQAKFELVLNRTTARSLGLEFPPTLLSVADEVIE